MTLAQLLPALLAGVLCFIPHTWKVVRHASTLFHEVGHAVVGILSGARLKGIALHPDSQGETVTAHAEKGSYFSRLFTRAAGYPAPFFFAGVLWFTALNYPRLGAFVALGAAALCFLFARSLFTFVVVLAIVAPVVVPYYLWNYEGHISWLVPGLAGLLVFAGARNIGHLGRLVVRGVVEGSDAHSLSEQTGLPKMVWVVLFWILGAASLWGGYMLTGFLYSLYLRLAG